MRFIVFFLILIFVTLSSVDLFLKNPPVWPDESVYADVAYNLIHEGRFGTDLLSGFMPGIENHALWYPPLYFYTLAGVFKLIGFSIESQRLLSAVSALGFLISFYFFIKLCLRNLIGISSKGLLPWIVVVPIILTMTNELFLRTSRMGRPEILILFLGTLSLCLLIWGVETKRRLGYLLISLSGLFASLAFLNHYVAYFLPLASLAFFILTYKRRVFNNPKPYLYALFYLSPLALWLLTVLPDIGIMREQFTLVLKGGRGGILEFVFGILSDNLPTYRIVIGISLLTTIIFIFYSLKAKARYLLFLSLLQVFAWVGFYSGRMLWSFPLVLPFTSLALVIIAIQSLRVWREKKQTTILFLISPLAIFLMVVIGIHNIVQNLIDLGGDKYSYSLFAYELVKSVPEGKSIFYTTTPDVYYALQEKKAYKKLYHFPPFPVEDSTYLKVLDDTDYIIYSGSLDSRIMLVDYFLKNQANIKKIGDDFQYQVLVVELKPKTERVH